MEGLWANNNIVFSRDEHYDNEKSSNGLNAYENSPQTVVQALGPQYLSHTGSERGIIEALDCCDVNLGDEEEKC